MTNRIEMSGFPGKQPDHERVLAVIKHSLAEGRYDKGMLPSYRQLVRELNVTRASVERAMAELERQGLIRRENRRGVFPRRKRRSSFDEKTLPLQCVNFVARSFAVLPSFVEADYLTGYTEALERLGIRMRFISYDELGSHYDRLCSPVFPPEEQGVVFINSCPPELVEWLETHDVPFVLQCFASYAIEELPPHFSVYVNKPGGAFQAVNHLLELGHRRIGFMGVVDSKVPPDPGVPLENTVFEGYRAALICAGLRCLESNLANTVDFDGPPKKDKQEVFAVAKAFLDRPDRPTAVLAVCDEFAMLLIEAAESLGLRIPEDLSIVGFDNQPVPVHSEPSLTTVSVPRRELAKSAVGLVLEAVKKPRVSPRTRILNTHLIIRETTAPPRATHNKNSADISSDFL